MKGDLIFYTYTGGDYYKASSYTKTDADDIGTHMGQDFAGSLLAPAPLKEDITNQVRSENGTRFKTVPFWGEKSVTLNIVITGVSRVAHNANLKAVTEILAKGHFAVSVPKVSGEVYFLNYQSSQSYSLSRSGKVSKLAIKCTEYKPTQRSFDI